MPSAPPPQSTAKVATPAIRTVRFHCRGHGFDRWSENYGPSCKVTWPKKKKNRSQGAKSGQDHALPESQQETESGFVLLPHLPTMSPLTHASPARRQLVPLGALAAVAASDVDAVGVLLAGVLPAGALIHVWGVQPARWGQ